MEIEERKETLVILFMRRAAVLGSVGVGYRYKPVAVSTPGSGDFILVRIKILSLCDHCDTILTEITTKSLFGNW